MLLVEWSATDVVVDGDTERQPREQVKLPLLWRDGLNGDVNVPPFSECACLGQDLLAGSRRAFGDD